MSTAELTAAPDFAREFQRRHVVLCRKHGLGNHPVTGRPPVTSPRLDWTGGYLDTHHAEYVAEYSALVLEFRAAIDARYGPGHGERYPLGMGSDVPFSEAELAR